jgi:hypothetical protein
MMARENAVVNVTELPNGAGLAFEVVGEGKFEVRLADLSENVKVRGLLHGLKQRVSDKAAIPRDTATGKSATPGEKFEAMRALGAHLSSGTVDWEMRKGVGGPRGPSDETRLVLRAIAEIQGISVADLEERLERRLADSGEKIGGWAKKMAGAPGAAGDNIRAKMAELRVQVDSVVDVSAELDGLMG